MSTDQTRRPRVLAVGLDGASFELLGSWMRSGDMPNLARLVAAGASGGLESVVPPLTPPAWTSALTGVGPGTHGIYNFLKPRFERPVAEFYGSSDLRVPALWDLLGARGLRSVVLHLPATYPPRPMEGAMVAGLPLTKVSADCTWPPELRDELVERVPGYKLFPDTLLRRTDPDAYFRDSVTTLGAQADEALLLMEREDWSFFYTLWHMGDTLKHYFWDDMLRKTGNEARRFYIRDYYREADRHLGRLVERAGPDTHVLVLSDHGHQGVRRAVHLNGWLVRNGYLKIEIPASLVRSKLWKKIQRKVRRVLRLPATAAGEKASAFDAAARTIEAISKAVVWAETKAYAEPPGFIWINLRGRHATGVVAPGEEYERVRSAIRDGMMAIRDPESDMPVFDRILTREEAFSGPALDEAPDLVAMPREGYLTEYGVQQRNDVANVRQVGFNGYHVMRGMLAMAGPGIPAGAQLAGARIVDVAPTVLHLLGLPVQPWMEGKVLDEAAGDRPVTVEEIPVELSTRAGAGSERDSIEQSLRDLGYM
jgi:predicted AlkP superfamily phosphohydrolase/phosphomutase